MICQNRARNRFQNRLLHRFGTRSGTTDQNQNQNQTVLKAGLVVVGGALCIASTATKGLGSCNANETIR